MEKQKAPPVSGRLDKRREETDKIFAIKMEAERKERIDKTARLKAMRLATKS